MWGLFLLAFAASCILLFLPGFFVYRGLGFSRIASVACAPLAALIICSIITTVLWKAGVFCSWWILLLIAVFVGLAFYLVGASLPLFTSCAAHAKLSEPSGLAQSNLERFASSAICPILYIATAGVAYYLIFVLNVDDASSFVQYYDNMHHIGSIQSFLLSGNWSSFGTTSYPQALGNGISPTSSSSGFYPSAWHCVAAFAASLTGCSVSVAENASIAVFVVIVFPLGMCLLLNELFADKPLVSLFGAIIVPAFAFYPWRLMTFGPLFPNIASMSLIPGAAYLFIRMTEGEIARPQRALRVVAFVLVLGSMAFSQPNTVFTLGLFLAPYLIAMVSGMASDKCGGRVAVRLVVGAITALLVVLLWLACYRLPFLQSVIQYSWPSYTSLSQAFGDIVNTRYLYHPQQLALSLAIAVGAIAAIIDRRRLWLVVSYALAGAIYVVVACMDGELRHVLAGFWYTDPNRIIAFVVIFAMPLAAWGLASLANGFAAIARLAVSRIWGKVRLDSAILSACALAAAALFAIVNYWPNYLITGQIDSENAFDVAGSYMQDAFKDSNNAYFDREERDFVHEVQNLVNQDDGIANNPNDGSASSYGLSGANVLYRFYDEAGSSSELESSGVIRTALNEVATHEDVKLAARELNLKYVLLLKRDPSDGTGFYHLCYDEAQWRGIDGINDDTPGFEVVLAEGDMRLYKITAVKG